MSRTRIVEPEILDVLAPSDPRAQRSRRDLKRINGVMLQVPIMARLLRSLPPPRRVLEIGCGDGTFLLSLLPRLPEWRGTHIVLLDKSPIVTTETMKAFAGAGRQVEVAAADVFDYLTPAPRERFDLIVANLFLHHFEDARLEELLACVAGWTNAFVACEPERSAFALYAARMLWALGCNAVTRHDAVVSVRAGFRGNELSVLWPRTRNWIAHDDHTLFTHTFIATPSISCATPLLKEPGSVV